MLCSECFSTTVLYNHLSKHFEIEKIVIEKPARGIVLLKRRIKKLGMLRVLGQILFAVLIPPILKLLSGKRIKAIIKEVSFDLTPLPEAKKVKFDSVNEDKCIDYLESVKPSIVIVNGTRILSKRLLDRLSSVFINMHTGITPDYRGVHGGYWALVNNDYDKCGVTIHLVDQGIDTGGILYQDRIMTTAKDNFLTYPFLQFAKGIPLMEQAVYSAINNSLELKKKSAHKGKLWSHPTIFQYLFFLFFKGKK